MMYAADNKSVKLFRIVPKKIVSRNAEERRKITYQTDSDKRKGRSNNSSYSSRDHTPKRQSSARSPKSTPLQFDMELENSPKSKTRSRSNSRSRLNSRRRPESRSTPQSRRKSRSPLKHRNASKERSQQRHSERLVRERDSSYRRMLEAKHSNDPVDTDQSLYDDDLQFRIDDL